MTIPIERTKSVVHTRELLESIVRDTSLPATLREHANWCLRHFPLDVHLELSAQEAPSLWASPSKLQQDAT